MTTKSVVAQKMQELKLNGCLDCFVDHYDEMINSNKTSLEILNELLIAEQNAVSNRKVLALLNKSNIRYPSSNLTVLLPISKIIQVINHSSVAKYEKERRCRAYSSCF